MTTAKALQLNIIFIATEPFKLIWYQCPKIVKKKQQSNRKIGKRSE